MLIDLQTDYVSGGDLLAGQESAMLQQFPDLPVSVAKMLAAARSEGVPVVHIRGKDSADHSISKWLPWWNTIHGEGAGAGKAGAAEPWAAEQDGEPVFVKHAYDAFHSDEVTVALLKHLYDLGIKRLYMGGCLTKACVGFSANSAFTLGFEVILIEDCCADRSREHHEQYINMYDGYHMKVMKSDEAIGLLKAA